ncbi:hypothetical protein NA56DRAFT_702677 [Hyaloscypha hepaticicola]|uniref:Uncharacterized protein n=1 Tax=Hyaloscypha hepaticicola TaxID=2082293 RepID=A0A2J6Q7Q9_9HELO|nr:hypothetical protein NA56DRAFT_702677 [Hyaloscypha hepaticicola]
MSSPKVIVEDRAIPTVQMFSKGVVHQEKAPNTSVNKPEAKIIPKIAVAASQRSILFKQAVKGSNTSNTPAKRVLSVSIANLRHCVITISSDSFTMFNVLFNKLSAGVDVRYAKQGIIGMLNDILWENVYLLEDRKSSFWKEVMVKGYTTRVKEILKMRNMLKRGNKKLFKARY